MASVAERRSELPPKRQRSVDMSQCANRILDALPQKVFAAIEPHLQLVKLSFAEVVAETDQSITQVYFPFSGVVSLVVDIVNIDQFRHALTPAGYSP